VATVIETERESKFDSCVECCVRDRDFSQKKVYRCELCDRWFCENHLEPRLVFVKNLDAIENIPEAKALYFTEIEGKEEKGHPDFEYSRRKFQELKMEEKGLNELIKQALDRMNHYYDEVEIPEKPIDLEAERKKTVEMLSKEEEEIEKKQQFEKWKKESKNVKITIVSEGDLHFSKIETTVPKEVYADKEHCKRIEKAKSRREVEAIILEYYRNEIQK
jgi:hypothetical protein